jgi:hypothetical protein
MGHFYTNYTLKGPGQQAVADALAGRDAIVTPDHKGCILVLLAALATVWFPREGYSQGDLAPLYLFITGSGSITRLQDGQLLNSGQSYHMTAIPDEGFKFDSWQPVVVTVVTLTNYSAAGDPILPPLTEETYSVEDTYINTPTLRFTMQPVNVISQGPDFSITQRHGWQANFVPVPNHRTPPCSRPDRPRRHCFLGSGLRE